MADKTRDDPREQIRQLYADARREFARDVDGLITELQVFSASVGDALGEISREDAVRGLRRFVLEKFDERLPLRPVADPVLLQLVREAYELLTVPDSRLDLRDWVKAAHPFLERGR